jgi:hypothetical protein
VEGDCSVGEDIAVAVVRVYVLLVMTMVPIGGFGFGDLR